MQNNGAFRPTKYRSPLEIAHTLAVACDVTCVEAESHKAPFRTVYTYCHYNSTAFLDWKVIYFFLVNKFHCKERCVSERAMISDKTNETHEDK